MRHAIRFRKDTNVTLHPPQGESSKALRGKMVKGQTLLVMIRPYVKNGVEYADLLLEDGGEATGIRYADFKFIETEDEEIE